MDAAFALSPRCHRALLPKCFCRHAHCARRYGVCFEPCAKEDCRGAISTSGSGASARATRGAERAHRARRATRCKPKSKRESQKICQARGGARHRARGSSWAARSQNTRPRAPNDPEADPEPSSLRTGRTTRATQLRGSMPHPCAAHCPAHPTSRTLATRRTRARRLRRAPPS